MKPLSIIALTTAAAFALPIPPAVADGSIQQLPTDGSWVPFEVTGEGRNPAGEIGVTLKGTLTLKSVGREMLDGAECRWIETESKIEFTRGDRNEEVSDIL